METSFPRVMDTNCGHTSTKPARHVHVKNLEATENCTSAQAKNPTNNKPSARTTAGAVTLYKNQKRRALHKSSPFVCRHHKSNPWILQQPFRSQRPRDMAELDVEKFYSRLGKIHASFVKNRYVARSRSLSDKLCLFLFCFH